ncbi:MAG: hypothetical protein COV07_00865 [Candidatus Vogelbacteria bacterium CG10_big_fil_rev_8_21_14_0_10_45_14]|uniref:Uncharacterized protein n=1 Tax=Candidatus Vogelbacteria bacterium CG10_big_fil_rev_8_21_14_0_10_45_14 TaxID=1975042 RepID=A0A2H0RKL8_9BACT|nr:MAG: hypothetical protein COV07_00865 [Candidatus Vogelbacteria bacterium CG10_big_fil_rev_8_21_14_0_10_45_14]
MRFDQQQIRDAFQRLPRAVGDIVSSVDTASTVMKIGEKNGLHLDQIGKLADEIGYLIVGLTKKDEFVKYLKSELGVDDAKATAVAKDVNEEILEKVREALREKADEGDEVKTPPHPSPKTGEGVFTPPQPSPKKGEGEEGKGTGGDVVGVGDREAILRELESPEATPISGRRVANEGEGIRPASPEGDSGKNYELGIKENVKSDGLEETKIGEDEVKEDNAKKEAGAVKVEESATPKPSVDPYREMPE